MSRLSSLVIASSCAVIIASAPAQAQPRDALLRDKISAAVQISDLDLATVKGRRSLDRRVHSTAFAICTGNGGRDLSRLADEARCRREAMRSAETQVASALAAAAHRDAAAIAAR